MLSKITKALKKWLKSPWNTTKKLFKNKRFVLIFIIALVLLLIIISSSFKKKPIETVTIEKGSVIQEVSLTGTVKPTRNIDYAFDRSGRVSKIYVKTGDVVKQGQILMSLDNGDVYAQYKQAQSALTIQQIKLNDYYNGARPEDLQVAQNQYNDAKQKLEVAYKNMYSSLFSDYNTVNSLIRNNLLSVFSYMGDWEATSPVYNISFKTCYAVNSTNSPLILRKEYENTLNQWKLELDTLANDHASIYIQASKNKTYLDNAYYLLNSISNVIDPVNCNIYGGTDKTNIDNLRSTIDSVKASIETTRASLLSSKSSLDTLDLAFNNASQNLETKKHPYTQEDIDTQKAIVDQAKANLDNYLSIYNKTVIYAPFDSKVTKIVPEVGNIINANTTVISLIGGDTYQIETYVAESDIAKIKINNTAKITLDAYSSDIVFTARVLQIDLSASSIEGVASYKTILKFDKEDQRIMPGMTANIDIMSNKKENVIYIPSRAIITKNGKKFVKLIANNKTQETNIITGIRGSDGRTEIISGLKVGDKIIMN